MTRKVLKIKADDDIPGVEYWELGNDAYLVEQKALLIFVKTKLGTGLTVLPVKSERIVYDSETLSDIKKAFTDLHNVGKNSAFRRKERPDQPTD